MPACLAKPYLNALCCKTVILRDYDNTGLRDLSVYNKRVTVKTLNSESSKSSVVGSTLGVDEIANYGFCKKKTLVLTSVLSYDDMYLRAFEMFMLVVPIEYENCVMYAHLTDKLG